MELLIPGGDISLSSHAHIHFQVVHNQTLTDSVQFSRPGSGLMLISREVGSAIVIV
jgi:hypothetical protein